jgi:hypothetical protein
MMKKIKILIILIFSAHILYSQNKAVGINTPNPETELHVNGSMKTLGIILKDRIESLGASENYTYLIKSPSPENKITTYNNSFLSVDPAPINQIQFQITCDVNDKDWINEYNTKINSNKFLVVISSFGFTQPILQGNLPDWVTPLPQIYAYYSNNTWKLKADFQGFHPPSTSAAGVWTINLLVFDKAYAKEFNFSQNLGGSAIGAATSALIQF